MKKNHFTAPCVQKHLSSLVKEVDICIHCSLCLKAFYKLAYLTKHKRTHSGDKSLQCSYCEKTFYRSCTLNKHKQSHIGEKPFQCSICQKSSTQPSHLTMHTQEVIVESIHNNATSVKSRIKIID